MVACTWNPEADGVSPVWLQSGIQNEILSPKPIQKVKKNCQEANLDGYSWLIIITKIKILK